MAFEICDKVGYKSHQKDEDFTHIGVVLDVIPNLPGYGEAAVKIDGKGGYVMASHCVRMPE